jgi:hypothetical protein
VNDVALEPQGKFSSVGVGVTENQGVLRKLNHMRRFFSASDTCDETMAEMTDRRGPLNSISSGTKAQNFKDEAYLFYIGT